MNNVLITLLVAGALSSALAFGADRTRSMAQMNRHGVEFALHGTIGCMLVDDKVLCGPGTNTAPIKLAAK